MRDRVVYSRGLYKRGLDDMKHTPWSRVMTDASGLIRDPSPQGDTSVRMYSVTSDGHSRGDGFFRQ